MQHAFTSKTIDGANVNCGLAQDMFDNVKNVVLNVRRLHKQQNLSKKLILYSVTRFGGAFDMLVVFSNVFDEVADILDSNLLSTYSRINKDLLYEVCEFLCPFVTVLDTLSDSQRATLYRVLPSKQLLINKCILNDNDKEGVKELKHFLGKRLDEKWEISNEHLIASLIHLNLKHFDKCPQLRERAIFLLKQEMLKRQDALPITSSSTSLVSSSIVTTSSISSSSTTLAPVATAIGLSARKKLLLEMFDKQPVAPEKNNVEQELENYLTSTSGITNEVDDDILSYWKEHQHVFPLIASIARDILAIPASNRFVERLFSSCKNTITDRRTRLAGDKLNKIMFLQKNMNILKKEFRVSFAEMAGDENMKRKNDTIIDDDQSIQKKLKQYDYLINHQKDDYFVNVESEDHE